MLMVHICEQYHWDYETYMRQPMWFLELIHKKLEIDGKKAQRDQANTKLKGK
jgi:hypothetical protein